MKHILILIIFILVLFFNNRISGQDCNKTMNDYYNLTKTYIQDSIIIEKIVMSDQILFYKNYDTNELLTFDFDQKLSSDTYIKFDSLFGISEKCFIKKENIIVGELFYNIANQFLRFYDGDVEYLKSKDREKSLLILSTKIYIQGRIKINDNFDSYLLAVLGPKGNVYPLNTWKFLLLNVKDNKVLSFVRVATFTEDTEMQTPFKFITKKTDDDIFISELIDFDSNYIRRGKIDGKSSILCWLIYGKFKIGNDGFIYTLKN